ncbi:hypothetical protein MKW94_009830 [Papaver nudicaule]|uniref:ARM repeat superfamily protein n=1 Tax=Papaver nudicaule TaxID=74823 RepID=A0AA41SGT7_PAPNU|nr:hypothetical protein [Papaver nudicaule]
MEEPHLWISESTDSTVISSTIGKVINTLLSSRPKKLEDSISYLGSASLKTSGSLEEPLCVLKQYVRDAVEKQEPLDQILVPMIENSLTWKDSRRSNQVLVLLNWLFEDESVSEALAVDLVTVIKRKDDRYIALGWCILIRALVERGISKKQSSDIGIQVKHQKLLKIFSSSISHLTSVVCSGSKLQDGFELPTRLSVAVADCILVLTEALIINASTSKRSPSADKAKILATSTTAASDEKQVKSISALPQGIENVEMDFILWNHLDELINLVQKLLAWSRKSRPLHAKGLEHVLKWLREIKGHYTLVPKEAGGDTVKTGMALLSSCWKHYCMLLRLEDYRFSKSYMEMLNQYISGIQFYTMDYSDDLSGNKDGGMDTIKFFLSCISLILGRLDSKQFEIAMSEQGLQLSRNLLSQLQCADEDVIERVICILRVTLFRRNCVSDESSFLDNQLSEEVLSLLLNLLDERDNIAKAVVSLIAEFCSRNVDSECLQEVFTRLTSGNSLQRRNAMDVISELVHVSSGSENALPVSTRKYMIKHLVDRLGDDELSIRIQSSNLLPMTDPHLVLPDLVRLVYSPDERTRSSACDALAAVLKSHNKNPNLIIMLIDYLSNRYQSPGLSRTPGAEGGGSNFDGDRILGLVPEWAKSVEDWNIFIEQLVDKMFSEPSNVVIARFLSCISEYLADTSNVLLPRVLLHMQGQKEMCKKLLATGASGIDKGDDSCKLRNTVFDRLCPLLIIRLLPLRVFDDLNSSIMYGHLLNEGFVDAADKIDSSFENCSSIAVLLVNRAINIYEFEDVRKLAAQLCGHIHPEVLYPMMRSQLESATCSRDIVKIKACLFAICTSLALRGSVPSQHLVMVEIRKILEMVLSWPSLDGDEENVAPANLVLNYVIQQLIQDKNDRGPEKSALLSFRLCMANVMISACQKISNPRKKRLAKRIIPVLISSAEVIANSDIRAACIQVLFSAVYHLKLAILPYSSDLLRLSIKALQEGSDEEKMAGVKLMASLMSSEDAIVESIANGLLEANSLLTSISAMNTASPELRQVCEKLRVCMMSPIR